MKLYDRLVQLKAAAAIIFDREVAKETPKEQLAEAVAPAQHSLERAIEESLKIDLKDFGQTIVRIQNNAGAWAEQSKWCREKADQEMEFAKKLRLALWHHMHHHKMAYLEVDGLVFTFSADGLDLSLR